MNEVCACESEVLSYICVLEGVVNGVCVGRNCE